jgi:hypothetical protein
MENKVIEFTVNDLIESHNRIIIMEDKTSGKPSSIEENTTLVERSQYRKCASMHRED